MSTAEQRVGEFLRAFTAAKDPNDPFQAIARQGDHYLYPEDVDHLLFQAELAEHSRRPIATSLPGRR